MTALAAFLLLATAASAALSPWLALITGWAGLIVVLLAGINAYRGWLEASANKLLTSGKLVGGEVVIGRLQRNGFVRVQKR